MLQKILNLFIASTFFISCVHKDSNLPHIRSTSSVNENQLNKSYEFPVDKNTIITQEEIDLTTDRLISILEKTKYFDFVDSRIQGWPASDRRKDFWFGTYWSGVRIFKKNNEVTYLHSADGADNNGFRTSSYLESACYAQELNPQLNFDPLIRKLIRGFSSWILASDQTSKPNQPKVFSRAHYPTMNPISEENNRKILIDYSLNTPGIDGVPSQYVYIKDNPTFGEIYTKNKRSRDDIGDVIRAIVQTKSCEARLSVEAKIDLEQMRELYRLWAMDADANNFDYPEITKDAEYKKNVSSVSIKIMHNSTLPGVNLSVRLMHQNNPGKYKKVLPVDFWLEKYFGRWLNGDAYDMMRTSNQAAVLMTRITQHNDILPFYVERLQKRVNNDEQILNSKQVRKNINREDIASSFISSANTGLLLSPNQIRYIHEGISLAHQNIKGDDLRYHIFDSSTPDGEYAYDAPEVGIPFRALGLLLGTCISQFKTDNKIVNCDKLKNYLTTLEKK